MYKNGKYHGFPAGRIHKDKSSKSKKVNGVLGHVARVEHKPDLRVAQTDLTRCNALHAERQMAYQAQLQRLTSNRDVFLEIKKISPEIENEVLRREHERASKCEAQMLAHGQDLEKMKNQYQTLMNDVTTVASKLQTPQPPTTTVNKKKEETKNQKPKTPKVPSVRF